MPVLAWPVAALMVTGQAQPARVADSTPGVLTEYVRRASALGVSGVVLLADGDRILVHAGLGWRDPDHRVPNDTAGLFYIASLSKQFVAAAALLLEQEGRLRTGDSIGEYLADVPPDKRSITIADLMYHRSGLPRYGFDPDRRDWAAENRAQSVRGILSAPLDARPGTRFGYQNSNYVLLTAIVEQVSGASIEGFLETRFFRPAGMRHTYAGSRVTQALASRAVWSLGDQAEAFTILDRVPSYLSLGRGVVTTAGDLYRWLRALGTGRVFSEASLRKLFSIGAELEPRYGYAGGWYVRTDSTGAPRLVFHRGDLGGYRSEARLSLPSGRIAVALTNQSFRGGSLTETLLNDLSGIGFRGERNPLPPVHPDTHAAGLMAGGYAAGKSERLDVRASGGRLEVTGVGQRSVDWLLESDSTGWERRSQVMDASMASIARLNRAEDPLFRSGRSLPAHQVGDFKEEWSRLSRHGGRLKSYQRLGVVHDAGAGADVAIIRLLFARDSLLLGVGWMGDTLAFTAPGIGNPISPSVFASMGAGRWASYDWERGTVRTLRFVTSTGSQLPRGLILETRNGPIRFGRQDSGGPPQER